MPYWVPIRRIIRQTPAGALAVAALAATMLGGCNTSDAAMAEAMARSEAAAVRAEAAQKKAEEAASTAHSAPVAAEPEPAPEPVMAAQEPVPFDPQPNSESVQVDN